MLEKYKNKKVLIFLLIGEKQLTYEGQIKHENETHFEFTDKLGQDLIFSKDTLKQIKVLEVRE